MKATGAGNPHDPECWVPIMDARAAKWVRTGFVKYALTNQSSQALDQSTAENTGPAESWHKVMELERTAAEANDPNFRFPNPQKGEETGDTRGLLPYTGGYDKTTRAALFCYYEHLRQVNLGFRP